MIDKHTYNLALMFGAGVNIANIATIVCYHDMEINPGMVIMIANSYSQLAIRMSQCRPVSLQEFVDIVNKGLLNDYPGLKTVVIKSDVIIGIGTHLTQNPSSNTNTDVVS